MKVLFSVAHSSKAPGATNGALLEYMVSLRATLAAFRNLTGEGGAGCEVEIYDCGGMLPAAYSVAKPAIINTCKPDVAVEIHCNASEHESANYAEAIYFPGSDVGAKVAGSICGALSYAYAATHKWPVRGPRANSLEEDLHWDFFLKDTHVPAVIVEGLFISNPDQAKWLASDGGAETYGILVAQGIRRWLGVA